MEKFEVLTLRISETPGITDGFLADLVNPLPDPTASAPCIALGILVLWDGDAAG
jgi:hypothetical protein